MAKPTRSTAADAAPASGAPSDSPELQTSFEVGGVNFIRSRREAQRLADAQAAGTSESAAGTASASPVSALSTLPPSSGEVTHG